MTPLLCLILMAPLAGNGGGGVEGLEVAPPAGCPGGTAGPGSPCCEAHPGDIFLFRNTNPLQNLAYFLLRSGGMTHVGIVVARPDGSPALLEAPGIGYPVILSNIASRVQSYAGRAYIRRRRIPLTPEQSARLTTFACSQEHKRFDTFGLFRPPLGCPLHSSRACEFRPEDVQSSRWFCSSLVVAAGVCAGLIDPCKVRPKYTSPQDLYSDRTIDLSRCWEEPVEYPRCGPRTYGWWSRSSCGECRFWR
jgi:hypothetical protein